MPDTQSCGPDAAPLDGVWVLDLTGPSASAASRSTSSPRPTARACAGRPGGADALLESFEPARRPRAGWS